MEDKGVDFNKPPPEPEYPPLNRSVARSFLMREIGLKSRTSTVPTELQWAAEDKMIMRTHEEYRCHLPDVSRSTFLMVFSPDGKKVASTHGNHNVYVTDLTSGKNIQTLTGHPRTPWCIAFHPSSNQILASGCLGGQVRVWDLSGGSEIWMAESQTVIASLAFHPVDRMLVIASYNELHFWDWSQPEPFAKCFTSNEKEKVRYVAFDALGHKLITGVANAPVRPASQWDRVAAPQPPPQNNQLDSERRITICYRYMVEQYEQLVQRYYDLSRARSTLTMDRGTDPMEMEGESSDSHNTTSQTRTVPRPLCRSCDLPRRYSSLGNRPRVSSGTDEASASRSSTNFLNPPEPSQSEESAQPSLASGEASPSYVPNDYPRSSPGSPRRNPRFDFEILPSFSSFRTRERSSSVPSPQFSCANLPPLTSQTLPRQSTENSDSRPLLRLSLSPETIGFRLNHLNSQASLNDETEPTPNEEDPTPRVESGSVQQRLRNLMNTWCNRSNLSDGTSTEINSNVNSENEEQEEDVQETQPESHSEEEPPSEHVPSVSSLSSFTSPSRSPRNTEGSARRLSEASAVSQLRSQFHRLQSVYENRNSAYSSHAHVFSPETQAAERRLLNRLNEILVRPLPEPRTRRLFASRRSAFQPRSQQSATSTPQPGPVTSPASSSDIIGGVRYGITLLSRHINNMQRLCRARMEIIQLQQIRRMWEDLQSQIYALHGAVREGREGEGTAGTPGTTTTQASQPPTETSSTNAADLLTDDDSDGPFVNGELHWRLRRTLQTSSRRNVHKTSQPRTFNRNHPTKRSRVSFRLPGESSRRLTPLHHLESGRRQLFRQNTPSTPVERGEASSSHVSGETSTGTSDERASVRGVKRKSRDSDPLFRPRPSSSNQGQSTNSNNTANNVSTSSLAAVMRDTIVQLENMVWRHRNGTPQRNTRVSRFLRQREERRMRNLWDTESSHESSRDDQSEADSSQQRLRTQREQLTTTGVGRTETQNTEDAEGSRDQTRVQDRQNTPAGGDTGDTEWSRDYTRMRARHVLLLMVDSLTQFFENDNFTQRTTNEALNDRIHNLYVLLQLALNLTDLLLAQLVHSRRELEALRPNMGEELRPPMMEGSSGSFHMRRAQERRWQRAHERMNLRNRLSYSLPWRRNIRRPPPVTSPSTASPPPTPAPALTQNSTSPAQARRFPATSTPATTPTVSRTIPPYCYLHHANVRSPPYHSPIRPTVPIVRVNDLAPPPDLPPTPRFRPHSPPPMVAPPMFVPARFLHPARYMGGGLVLDESTSEDSSPQDRNADYFFLRAGYGSSSVILTDTPMSPHHRIQAWDFSNYKLPDLSNADKNVVVSECKIHNDASVDMSKDGHLLVTLLPSGRLSMTTLLGIYSLQWDTLGQLLYTTSFEQSIVSVSLSPTTRHLVVGLASRRVAIVSSDRYTNAQVFRLEGASPGRKAPLGGRGRLVHLRDLELSRHLGFMSLNCIRWAPNAGQGLVYGTNTGQLKILR